MRLLFTPEPNGLAHIIRLQAIALAYEELFGDQDEIIFAIEPTRQKVLMPTNNSKIKYIHHASKFFIPNLTLNKLHKTSRQEMIIGRDQEYGDLIKKTDPDIVITDMEISPIFAATKQSKKIVLIVNALFLPYRRGIAGEDKTSRVKNISGYISNQVIWGYLRMYLRLTGAGGKGGIKQYLKTFPMIMPEWKGYVHLSNYHPNLHFVGPIFSPALEAVDREFEDNMNRLAGYKKIVYVTFGGTGLPFKTLQHIVKQLVAANFFVIVSLGAINDKTALKLNKTDGYVAKYVSGISATNVADCVISHGSQGTFVHAIITATPIVTAASNADQLVHASKSREYKMGILLHELTKLEIFTKVYDPIWLEHHAAQIPVQNYIEAVKEIVNNDSYKQAAIRAQKRFGVSTDGSIKAAKIIHDHLMV